MKKLLFLAIALTHGMYAGADVMVELHGSGIVPIKTLVRAQRMAAAMFVEIGVQVRWTHGKPSSMTLDCPSTEGVLVEVDIADVPRGAGESNSLGVAWPYAQSGRRASVGYDPSLYNSRPGLLAHVLAHEIGHILQGMARHSKTGIMRAFWRRDEVHAMEQTRLSFDADDSRLILANLPRTSGACAVNLVAAR